MIVKVSFVLFRSLLPVTRIDLPVDEVAVSVDEGTG